MIGMPNILIFQIILPLFSPLADLFMFGALLSGIFSLINADVINTTTIAAIFSLKTSLGQVLLYYAVFVLVDVLFGFIAFKIEKQKYWNLIYIIPQRFVWRQLMYYVLFKSLRKALKGEFSTWGILKRSGNVSNPI